MSIACGRITSIAILVLLLPSFAYPQQVDVHALIDDAVSAGQWQQVVELLEPHLAEAPDEAVSYWYGVARYELGDAGGAVAHLNHALELSPDSIPTARYLARCYEDLADSAAAVALAKRFPTDAQTTFSAGKTLIQEFARATPRDQSNYPLHQMNAITWLERSTAIDDQSAEAYRWLAFAYKKSYGWERVLSGTLQSIALGLEGWETQTLTGDRYRWEHALRSINQAIALGPVGWEAHTLAGECYEELHAPLQAAQAYLRASELAPQPQRVGLLLKGGELLNLAGEYHEAVQAYKQVMVLDFGHDEVRYRLGEAALNAKDYYLALWAFKESRALDGSIDSLYGVGRCQYELGNYEDAELLISQAIKEYDDSRDHHSADFWASIRGHPISWNYYLGRAQLGLNKRPEAKEALVKAFNAKPDNLIYARWAFKAYMMTDDPYGAIEVCEKLAEKGYPDVAMDGIAYVLKTWPRPRFRDLAAGHRAPHTVEGERAMAKIAYGGHRFREAVGWYRKLGRLEGKHQLRDAGWVKLAAGDFQGALNSFRDLSQHDKRPLREIGYLGGATTLILQGKAGEADKALSMIKNINLFPVRDACILWAGVAVGDREAWKMSDPFTLLGVVGWEFSEQKWNRGLIVRAILPGSLLDQSPVKVRPMDVLLKIGVTEVDNYEAIHSLLSNDDLWNGPVTVHLRRGSQFFYVQVRFLDVVTELRQLDKPGQPDAVEQGADE